MRWPDEIVGQGPVLERLEAEAASDRRAHAYVFSGPRGIGKRLAAEAFAGLVLCTGEAPPCGACPGCRARASDVHPDLDIVEPPRGKRALPVESVRNLVARIALRPALARGRVFLIDRAHTLTEEAANALLKTLEEPPPGSLLVLVTERVQAILPTILSRCRVVRFRPAPAEACARYLKDRGLEKAEVLAELADGSPFKAEELAVHPVFIARREIAEGILTLEQGSLWKSGEEILAKAGLGPGTREPLETQRRTLGELFDFLLTFAQDIVRRAHAVPVRNRDLEDLLDRAVPDGPVRWGAAVRRLREARRQLWANVVPGLVLDALLWDLAVIRQPPTGRPARSPS
jgi:DNA polymerase-3 subunit delta'